MKRHLTRRQFITVVGSSVTVAALPTLAETSKTKPNILVIMSDEHNASVLGCAGNKIIHTPNLDALATRGVLFGNCYTNSPLCVPSRLSFTSGNYISHVGAWNNSCRLSSPDYPSVASIVNQAGYESFLCGKMHYDATHRYGFTEIGGKMNQSAMDGSGERRTADDLTPKPGISERFEKFHTGETSSVIEHDKQVTAGATEFLKNRKNTDKPFLLIAGYLAPHFPLTVPQKFYDVYQGKVPMPVIPAGYLDSLPLNYKHLRIGFNIEDVPDDIVRKGRELYYGFVQWIDEEIGRVLATLADSELAENTIVIYTTDHGENMGEHGLWWKNCLYDTAAHIPFIISWPKRWSGGQRRTQVCSLIDVTKTIADLAGACTPEDWDGDSMVQWLDDPKAKWKDLAVSEYYAHNIASGYAMIRTGAYKYVYHTAADANHPAQRELYNLEADPGELHNLANESNQAQQLEEMHAALVKELGENLDKTESRCRADFARGYPGSTPKNAKKPTNPDWLQNYRSCSSN